MQWSDFIAGVETLGIGGAISALLTIAVAGYIMDTFLFKRLSKTDNAQDDD